VKFEYAVIKPDDLRKGLHPTDAELKAFYESHKAQYNNSIPEKRKVKYAVVDLGKIQSGSKLRTTIWRLITTSTGTSTGLISSPR